MNRKKDLRVVFFVALSVSPHNIPIHGEKQRLVDRHRRFDKVHTKVTCGQLQPPTAFRRSSHESCDVGFPVPNETRNCMDSSL